MAAIQLHAGRGDMADTFLRYLVLLGEIPRAPRRVGASELTARLEAHGIRVTRRTVQRDLDRLSSILPIACNDASKPYGWAWVKRAASGLPDELRLPNCKDDFPPFERPAAGTLSLKVRFAPPAQSAVDNIPAPRSVRRVAGWLEIEADVADTPELRAWLLGFGTSAEVLGPVALRREFRRTAAKLGEMYA